MICAEENTMVPLATRDLIAVREMGHCEYIAASLLQLSCMTLHRPNSGASRIVRIAGSVDSSNSDELLAKVELLLGTDHLSHLVIDLEGVVRLDSSGVGVLLSALRDSQKRGVRFTLCGMSKPLHIMLDRMRLASLFDIRTRVEEVFSL
jgi:anti-anti-sigma factor